MEETIILILKCLQRYEMLAVTEVGRKRTVWKISLANVMDFASPPSRVSSKLLMV